MTKNNVSLDSLETLRDILVRTEGLLLDFDGPMCSIFADMPASYVADQLRRVLSDEEGIELAVDLRITQDPFDVLAYAVTLGKEVGSLVESVLTTYEIEAVSTVGLTNGVFDLISSWHYSGRKLAIVSNNSHNAIEFFLEKQGLTDLISAVSARAGSDTSLLKPNPYLIRQAIVALSLQPQACTIVGDSIADIDAAKAAQVTAIGYVNRPAKALALSRASALVTSIEYIVEALG
ncbi:HAD family hydrolase [Saccharothrix longispora]|uniref:Beta-phosphoglucomutase-like phosphatase (HAD superfamily) n=1 Tax=Saccharothrix longispora TaxID=33920 RepID=A0ABU1Q3S2_9PSEU|nr:HAD-IA family hydrolase [Saccharothrix longispora]MDR6597552.1 beta-phosphoglucomutase-like phosphatase (HAD superfamily) [Saccharothrix longispora]